MKKQKAKMCECYHEIKEPFHPSDYIKGYYAAKGWKLPETTTRAVCWGTKECEQCSCGGDEAKCDFYPETRKAARKNKV